MPAWVQWCQRRHQFESGCCRWQFDCYVLIIDRPANGRCRDPGIDWFCLSLKKELPPYEIVPETVTDS